MELLSAVYLLVCIILYFIIKDRYQRAIWNYKDEIVENKSAIFHQDIYINAIDNSLIHGWFYPRNGKLVIKTQDPIIVMSHGLGSQKDMGLERYISRFIKSGYSVISIDYRSFGGSENIAGSNVRHWINPWYQIDDILSTYNAIVEDKVLGLSTLDVKSVFLWGTSLAGGHVLEVSNKIQIQQNQSSTDKKSKNTKLLLKGVISQMPHLDGNAASKRSLKEKSWIETLRVFLLCVLDTILSQYFRNQPFLIKIASLPNETSFMTYDQFELQKYFEKHPKQYLGNWHNLATARSMAYFKFYSPIKIVHNIKVPVLYIGASQDKLCPLSTVMQAVNQTYSAKLYIVDGTHQDIYEDKIVAQTTKYMIEFINKYKK